MKKLLLIILILLPCDLGAQEGCGEWVEVWQERLEDIEHGVVLSAKCCFKWYSAHHPDSVWVPKPCPDEIMDEAICKLDDYKAVGWKFSHFMFEVWDKQPCNPGGKFKLWCPPGKLDSSVVREAMCEEDYYMDNNHIVGWFPCYCLILDGVRYWMKKNPLQKTKKWEKTEE